MIIKLGDGRVKRFEGIAAARHYCKLTGEDFERARRYYWESVEIMAELGKL